MLRRLYAMSCGRGIALLPLVLLLSALLCACGERNESAITTSQIDPHGQYETEESHVLQNIALSEQEELTVLGGRDGHILASVNVRYPEGHPYAREMGISSYGSSLLLADLSTQSHQTVYTFPADTISCGGAIYSDGVVIAQLSNAGMPVFDYDIIQVTEQGQKGIWEGRCTEICGLAVLSDRTIVHAYYDSVGSLQQGVVVTGPSGEALYHGQYPVSDSGVLPLFCSDGTQFAFCVQAGDAPTVLVGDETGVLYSFSLNAGESVSYMAVLNQQLLLVLGSTDSTGSYTQRRQLRSLEGNLISESSGSRLFQLCTGMGNSVVGLSEGGLVLIWEENGHLGSQFIPAETAFCQAIPLASGHYLIYDKISLSTTLLQIGWS